MGTHMAPSYANLFMTEVETKIIESFKLKTGLEPLALFRFLEDIIFVWSHGEESLKDFFQHMQSFGEVNKMKTSLKFTFEYGKLVPFLDTTVTLKYGKIVSDLFCKSTDAHLCLRNDSCHPKSCMNGLAKGEFLRVRRICSSEEDFKARTTVMTIFFMKRGFKESDLNKALEDVAATNRENLLEPKEKKRNKIISVS
jgi:hypothetical protein